MSLIPILVFGPGEGPPRHLGPPRPTRPSAVAEDINCEKCGALLGVGDGDLNMTYFWCPTCAARLRPPTRWDNCPGCRAGVKHMHCHHPWQDTGGG